ncbi:7-carboxy-7-deazaguanine synthase QueE [Buchnera aphidicola]|uniref:7-carboxy-7-deazaguanine synthase n=1 Tax=Buchnera aphidicola str. USDA (Myzus persicae) TaxID=1009856 RepID=W0P5N6_BUCMP|nr:7-carboxy-7-deazaguanine synthase QueE [Buchnera aphidicola]AHG60363.1 Ygcf [Buchnera aphidicola str. USDA (Myzus persicae)]AHG60941.1 Ygcf [Buchnera aphidicola str. W106 (Myzus persicae)]AHG61513.1 Ygcf [Buchnera aphidicola str. G002 (Myzus persicae)]AHG62086.1 Ygcf [Buchnera aphidicola str. F009 (Myzus persicae)]WAI03339.1 MAG: 7-carboxy-7-deazaguanine synthase QueE [Buchnera aphidicola (Myzus persicae)]
MNYPVNEIFQTIQGEGYYTGTPSIFIRLQGCPIHCPWCDTKYTWTCLDKNKISSEEIIKKNTSNQQWSLMNVEQILLNIKIKKWTAKHIVITGGEPCIYNLLHLTETLEKKGFRCQIESSGTQLIQCSLNTWVTISPKKNQNTLLTAMLRSNEIKYPILKKEDLSYLDKILSMVKNKKKCYVSLQPISQNKEALEICIKTCIMKNWKLSIQLHKYILIK